MSESKAWELTPSAPPALLARRAAGVAAGTLLVALAAQVSIPLPGTPVPFTLQGPAVLIVGGLLGAGLGATSLSLYLLLGALGLPVFAPVGLPGLARLLGPTGGYLLAFPLAAACVGRWAAPRRMWRCIAAAVAGLILIHAGGVAQLAALGGDLTIAMRLGTVPFLLMDSAKALMAAVLICRFAGTIRARYQVSGVRGQGHTLRPDRPTPGARHPIPDTRFSHDHRYPHLP